MNKRNQSGAADFTAYEAIQHTDREETLKKLLGKIAEGRGFKIKLIRLEERKVGGENDEGRAGRN